MKKRILFISLLSLLVFQSCKKDQENVWKIEAKKNFEKAQITDISKDFYNPAVPLEKIKADYPWFQGTVTDEDFGKRRLDPAEVKLYKDGIAKINTEKLSVELGNMFEHVRTYFPKFQNPKVFLFSSVLQMANDPIIYRPDENLLFIDITGFLGDKSPYYKDVAEAYMQKSMNPENILPKVTRLFAENAVRTSGENQKFIDEMIYDGKVLTLLDAFIPDVSPALKMNYTPKQYDWDIQNESSIWNYFVENNIVFSDDARLVDRFISPAPFSKFYTAIDNESSPQVGAFIGWQICKKYFKENPDTKLVDFLKMNGTDIFNKADYKPKQP